MNNWIDLLGPMVWPLVFCSLVMLALILERSLFFITLKRMSKSRQRSILAMASTKQWDKLQKRLDTLYGLTATGVKIILDCRERPVNVIEDITSLWLTEQKTRLYANLGWLTLLAVASPLLGLLGTVLGMIEAFQAMASHSGAISPAVLADGLQQAMLTTAFGLCIAIPALMAAHAFRIWADSVLVSLETLLNRVLLSCQQIDIRQETTSLLSSTLDSNVSLFKEKQA